MVTESDLGVGSGVSKVARRKWTRHCECASHLRDLIAVIVHSLVMVAIRLFLELGGGDWDGLPRILFRCVSLPQVLTLYWQRVQP